jgi:uncharacterized zinc-type alcohol dehydrogenase-like protein
MIPVKGYAAHHAKAPLEPYAFERRDVGAHDVLINIHYCGICHSDIHQARNEWGGAHFPLVPGHEIVGTVERVGQHVSSFRVGDHVGVGCLVDSCRRCQSCEEGLEQYCTNGFTATYGSLELGTNHITQGGYSTKIVVDEHYLLRLPQNLPLAEMAPLLCAGITLYSPLKHWQIGPGKKVAIIGLGGLGHVGVKIAHALGADVTVLSHSPAKEHDAKRFGAHHFYTTNDMATFETLRNTFDLMIYTVSSVLDLNQYLTLLKRDATLVMIGIPEHQASVHPFSLIAGRRKIAGSLIGGIKETQEMLDFCSKHAITAEIELISAAEINKTYERILKSDIRYRAVIDFQAS